VWYGRRHRVLLRAGPEDEEHPGNCGCRKGCSGRRPDLHSHCCGIAASNGNRDGCAWGIVTLAAVVALVACAVPFNWVLLVAGCMASGSHAGSRYGRSTNWLTAAATIFPVVPLVVRPWVAGVLGSPRGFLPYGGKAAFVGLARDCGHARFSRKSRALQDEAPRLVALVSAI